MNEKEIIELMLSFGESGKPNCKVCPLYNKTHTEFVTVEANNATLEREVQVSYCCVFDDLKPWILSKLN